ncbi:MAG: carboxypeptidase-like regulatory domain-containing protein [Schleiferiaceae bacterium]|jgi:hypothetical protein|nr:carboxypeptidase-like regulatory domain-containing protein [Schleiferiaceae bacterium]
MKKLYLKITLLFFIVMLAENCFADSPVFEFSGTISDKKSGKMIENAKVQLERNGEVIIETNTKKDGSFMIRLPEEDIEKGTLKVRVRKRGYRTEEINAIPNVKNRLNIQLEKVKAIPIMVPKKSPTGQYIIVSRPNTSSSNVGLNSSWV